MKQEFTKFCQRLRLGVFLVGTATFLPAQVVLTPGDLFGVNSGSGGTFLAKIDKTTGAVTNIGPTGITVDGLTFSPGGELFAADNTHHRLVTLNVATGAIDRDIGPFTTSIIVEGLSFHPVSGELFGIDVVGNRLIRFDTTTGGDTVVGGFGLGGAFAGLAFNLDGSLLYAVNHSNGGLYWVNQTTGAASLLGTGSVGPLGLDMDPTTGMLFVAEWRGGSAPMTLATVDLFTGARSHVGTMTGALQIEGLAFVPIPEPSTVALLATGSILLMLFWRKSQTSRRRAPLRQD